MSSSDLAHLESSFVKWKLSPLRRQNRPPFNRLANKPIKSTRPCTPLDFSRHDSRTHAPQDRTPPRPQTPSVPKPYCPVATGEAPGGGGAAGLLGGSGVLAELLGAGGCPAVAEARGARAVVRRRPGHQTGGGWSGRRTAAASSQDIGRPAGRGSGSGLQPAQQR